MAGADGTFRAARDRVPGTPRPLQPLRPIGDDLEDDVQLVAGVGSADCTLYERHVTEDERERWRDEDAVRDSRRIPLGFRSPG